MQQCKDIDKKFKQRYPQDFSEPPRVCIWFHLVVLDAEARSWSVNKGVSIFPESSGAKELANGSATAMNI